MRTTLLLLVLLFAWQSSGWAKQPRKRSIKTAEQAMNVVRRYLRAKGGDPARVELSAHGGPWHGWTVTAWGIVYPNETGSSRFVPGGYTEYTVSVDGRVTKALGGL